MYTILCVDDDINEMKSSLDILCRELGCRTITTTSYIDAMDYITGYKFDAFILDIELKGGRNTGIQLAEQIRQDTAYTTTPIIFVSMYTHYSKRLLSHFHNSAFLSKPFSQSDLLDVVGSFFGLPKYIKQNRCLEPFLIPIHQCGYTEIQPKDISFIEINRDLLTIQFICGETVTTKCAHGCFKMILSHINKHSITHLRQIYRSIIINVDQIKNIDMCGNGGMLWLFDDPNPKPIGSKFKDQLSDLL